MKTVTWTTSTGTKIEVSLETVYGLDLQGHRQTSGSKQIQITCKVNGKDHQCIGGIKKVTGHETCVSSIGQVGLTKSRLNEINEVKRELEQSIKQHNDQLNNHSIELDKLGKGDINELS